MKIDNPLALEIKKYASAERGAMQQTVIAEIGELDGHTQNRLTEARIRL